MIIAGDIGGTTARLALYDMNLKALELKDYDVSKYSNLAAIISHFIETNKVSAKAACFGVPGPVVNGQVKTTNLPWQLSQSELSNQLRIEKLILVNDLALVSAALPSLNNNQLCTLHAGNSATPGDQDNTYAVIGVGTGTGQSMLKVYKKTLIPCASEGGHVDFAACDEVQIRLLKFLQIKFGRVSVERVLSGQGIVNIFQFLDSENHEAETALKVSNSLQPAAEISKLALKNESKNCVETLEIFCKILGSQAGNLALSYLSSGGVFISGGIAPKIKDKLCEGSVLRAYLNKGRLSSVVQNTPLHIIIDDHAALIGAANLAKQL